MDGIYIVRTNVAAEELDAQQTVRAYKSLSVVERAFRTMKTVNLKIRPIHHRLEKRVRAHVHADGDPGIFEYIDEGVTG